jgi:hypothetical protein
MPTTVVAGSGRDERTRAGRRARRVAARSPDGGRVDRAQLAGRLVGIGHPAPDGSIASEVVAVPGLLPDELVVRESRTGELALATDRKLEYRFFREPAAAADGRVLVVRIVARGLERVGCRGNPDPTPPRPPERGTPRRLPAMALGTNHVTDIGFYVVEYQWTIGRQACSGKKP